MQKKLDLLEILILGMEMDYSFHKVNNEGIWTILVHENLEGNLYKYEIITSTGEKS